MANLVTVAVTQIEEQRKGYNGVTLTQFANDTTEPQIAAGSIVEIAGSLYEFSGAEAITGFAGIGNGNQTYIEVTASGATASAAFSTTAPTWDTDKQGYYNGGLVRTIGGSFKDGSGNATNKFLYTDPNLLSLRKYGNGAVEIPGALEVVAGGVTVGAGAITASSSSLALGGAVTGVTSLSMGGAVTGGTSLSMGGDLDMTAADPEITSTKPLDLQKGHYHDDIHDNFVGAPTQDEVFDFLAPAIPDIGDMVTVTGAIRPISTASDQVLITSFAERTAASTIEIHGFRVEMALDIGGAIAQVITNGDATNLGEVSLAY